MEWLNNPLSAVAIISDHHDWSWGTVLEVSQELQETGGLVSATLCLSEMLVCQFDRLLTRRRQHRQRLEGCVLLVAAPLPSIKVCLQVSEAEEFQISLKLVVQTELSIQSFRSEPVKLGQGCLKV